MGTQRYIITAVLSCRNWDSVETKIRIFYCVNKDKVIFLTLWLDTTILYLLVEVCHNWKQISPYFMANTGSQKDIPRG